MATYELRPHRWAAAIAVTVCIAVYILLSMAIIWYTWPLLLVPVSNLGLIGILIALAPLVVQLGVTIWNARGADWRVTFIRHSSKRVPSSHEYEAQYEFVVENRGAGHGVLKYIRLRLPDAPPFAEWDREDSLRCYLNPPTEERKPLKSLAIPPRSAHYLYVCIRVVEERDGQLSVEYATAATGGKRILLEEVRGRPFRIEFVFTKQAYQLGGDETVLSTKEFQFGDSSFRRPKS